MLNRRLMYLLIAICILTNIGSAELPNPVDAGVTMIRGGINAFLVGFTDDVFNASIHLNSHDTNKGGLLQLLSSTHDPYKVEKINEFRAISRFLFFIFAVLYTMWGGILTILQVIQNRNSGLSIFTKINPTSHIYEYIRNIIKIFIIIAFVDIFIICILKLNMALSHTILTIAATTISPDASNIPTYFALGIGILALSGLIAARTIIIGIVVSFAYILGFAFVIEQLQELAMRGLTFFVVLVFSQSIFIAFATVGLIITEAFIPNPTGRLIFYVVIVGLLIFLSKYILFWILASKTRIMKIIT